MVLQTPTKDGAPHLGQKHDTGRDFQILAHLEVAREVDRCSDDIMTPHGELR